MMKTRYNIELLLYEKACERMHLLAKALDACDGDDLRQREYLSEELLREQLDVDDRRLRLVGHS